jgi:hypothetical protein
MQLQQIKQQRQHCAGRRERGGHTAFVMLVLAVSAALVWLMIPG